MNISPIAWYSNKKSSIMSSVFGTDFMAFKIVMESIRGLRYKLCMMGVPIEEPTYTYGDNMSVIHNT